MAVRVFSSLELQYIDIAALRLALELLACEEGCGSTVEQALCQAVFAGCVTGRVVSEQAFQELLDVIWDSPSCPSGESSSTPIQGLSGTRWVV